MSAAQVPAKGAVTMPPARPITIAISNPAQASVAVAGSRRASVVATGWRVAYDRPRSPCASRAT
jgi:hypothetical protein